MDNTDIVAWIFTFVFVVAVTGPILALLFLPELDNDKDEP